MLVDLVLIIEIISIVICVHRVYAKSIKPNAISVAFVVAMSFIMIIVNRLSLSGLWSVLVYLVLLLYCIIQFKETVSSTIISVVLALVITSIVQFVCMLALVLLPIEDLVLRNLLGDIIVLLSVTFLLPFCRPNKLKEAVCRKHWLMYIIIAFVIMVIMLSLFILKSQHVLDLGLFLFGIPASAIILLLVMYWDRTKAANEQMKKEMAVMKAMQTDYEELVEKVRINQHGLKNHIMTVIPSETAWDKGEAEAEVETEYWNTLENENKYNRLLLVGNKTLGGFFYKKMQEMEQQGLHVTYRIETEMQACCIPDYYLIEMLGILLDNATEAVKENPEYNEVYIGIKREGSFYYFSVKNVYRVVKYDEMRSWFKLGDSTKGSGHKGIGLYRIQSLCKEWNCTIKCVNEVKSGRNWIAFELAAYIKEDGV